MHVISLKPFRDFWVEHADAEKPLLAWHREVEHTERKTFTEVDELYPHADKAGKFIVFDIGDNTYRLIAVIHFSRGKVYVRHDLTHEEYDRMTWKKD